MSEKILLAGNRVFLKKDSKTLVKKMALNMCIPSLGIDSKYRRQLNSEYDYQKLFRFYEEKILQRETEGFHILENLFKAKKRIAITCFEKQSERCHRGCIANLFAKNNIDHRNYKSLMKYCQTRYFY